MSNQKRLCETPNCGEQAQTGSSFCENCSPAKNLHLVLGVETAPPKEEDSKN